MAAKNNGDNEASGKMAIDSQESPMQPPVYSNLIDLIKRTNQARTSNGNLENVIFLGELKDNDNLTLFDEDIMQLQGERFYDSTSKISFSIYDMNTDRVERWNIPARILIVREFDTVQHFLDTVKEIEVEGTLIDNLKVLLQ